MKRRKTQTYTKLKVYGDTKSLRAFRKHITKGHDMIEVLGPMVLGENHTAEENAAFAFGDFGTKIIEKSENHIIVQFWSYYDPLIHGIQILSEQFPKLTFLGAYVTTLKAKLGHYMIHDGKCESGELDPKYSLEMKNFCCEWDDEIEAKWFRLADNWIADMIGEPLPA